MTSSKPTVLFIPGAWHLPDVFEDTRAALAARGFPSVAVGLPAIGAEPPTKGLKDDTVAVHQEIGRLSDESKQVVVVGHSYGGMVGAGAVKGLGFAERQKAGKNGGVIMLVYMAAFVAKSGTSLLDMLGGKWLPWMKLDVSTSLFTTCVILRSTNSKRVTIAELTRQQKFVKMTSPRKIRRNGVLGMCTPRALCLKIASHRSLGTIFLACISSARTIRQFLWQLRSLWLACSASTVTFDARALVLHS
jgi:hypothetical protein